MNGGGLRSRIEENPGVEIPMIDIEETARNLGYDPEVVVCSKCGNERGFGKQTVKYFFPCGCYIDERQSSPCHQNPDPTGNRGFVFVCKEHERLETEGDGVAVVWCEDMKPFSPPIEMDVGTLDVSPGSQCVINLDNPMGGG